MYYKSLHGQEGIVLHTDRYMEDVVSSGMKEFSIWTERFEDSAAREHEDTFASIVDSSCERFAETLST